VLENPDSLVACGGSLGSKTLSPRPKPTKSQELDWFPDSLIWKADTPRQALYVYLMIRSIKTIRFTHFAAAWVSACCRTSLNCVITPPGPISD